MINSTTLYLDARVEIGDGVDEIESFVGRGG